jgi:hypothetical protein
MITDIAELAAPGLGRLGPHAHALSVALTPRIHGRRSTANWPWVCGRGTQAFRDAAATMTGLADYQQAATAAVDTQFLHVQDSVLEAADHPANGVQYWWIQTEHLHPQHGPQVLAALNNAVMGLIRQHGEHNLPAVQRHFSISGIRCSMTCGGNNGPLTLHMP